MKTFLVAALLLVWACGSNTPSGPAGSAVTGATDTHCLADGGLRAVRVDESVCQMHPDGGTGTADYGDTLFNSEGNDDDCKYHMKFTASPIYENYDVTFTVTVTYLADGTPARGAAVDAQVFLSDTHPAPNTHQVPTEVQPGIYTVGPVRFDASGRWTVRFHFYETCFDSQTSPHGHAAFYLNVP
jgi:hypothetical protein